MKEVNARLLQTGATPVKFTIREGATLGEVLSSLNVTLGAGRVLSQNGRPASLSDPVKDQALVMDMPAARHG